MSSPYEESTRDDGADCKRCGDPLAGDNGTGTCFKCRSAVAAIILEQLGGPKIGAMLGTTKFYAEDQSLLFGFKGNRKMNKVRITLTWDDLYTMEFYNFRAPRFDFTPVVTETGLFNDMLVSSFERVTGLYLSL